MDAQWGFVNPDDEIDSDRGVYQGEDPAAEGSASSIDMVGNPIIPGNIIALRLSAQLGFGLVLECKPHHVQVQIISKRSDKSWGKSGNKRHVEYNKIALVQMPPGVTINI
jgi:hypothetical protein